MPIYGHWYNNTILVILSICCVSVGNDKTIDPTQVHKSLQRIREKKKVNFIPWGPASIQVALSQKSPYVEAQHRVSGLLMANHTSIANLFRKEILEDFDKMRKRKVHFHHFKDINLLADGHEFDDSGEVLRSLIDEYELAATPKYGKWDELSSTSQPSLPSDPNQEKGATPNV